MNEDDNKTPGTVKPADLVKAGCGVRFDPETLSPNTGFDFERAKELLEQEQIDGLPAGPQNK